MRFICRCVPLLLLVAVLQVTARAADDDSRLHLIRNGKANCAIVVPDSADTWNQTAAQWLAEYLKKSTGAELPIVVESKAPEGVLISIGHTQLARNAGVTTDDLKWDACRQVVKGNVLFLLGRDTPPLEGENPNLCARGTCRAVVTFLEDTCGVRWFLPGPMGEWVPHHQIVSVARDLNETTTPAFAYSSARFPYDPGFLPDGGGTPGAIANNYRYGIAIRPGGHTYYRMLPQKELFPEHPEYFALINGKRTSEGEHLCSSNPAVRNILIREMEKKFDQGFEVMSLGQEDGYVRCECPSCESLDNYRYSYTQGPWKGVDFWTFCFDPNGLRKTPCERVFLLHKAICDALAKSRPGKIVLLMGYAPTLWPSKKIDYWGDNVWVELTLPYYNQEVVDAWKGKTAGMTCQVQWGDVQLSMGLDVHMTPREAAETFRRLHRDGFLGIYQCPEIWGFQGPVMYEVGRLMGNPDQDYNALIKEYCDGVFEHAGATMLEFYQLLYDGREQLLPLEKRRLPGFPRDWSTEDLYLKLYPRPKLDRLESLLQRAEQQADTQRSKGWVKLVRDQMDFTRLVVQIATTHKAFNQNPDAQNFAKVKQAVDAFNAYRKRITSYDKSYADVWFPGYEAYCNFLTADARHESEVYYISWYKRKAEALKNGFDGMAIGYGGVYGYNFIKEPLTWDFSKGPEGVTGAGGHSGVRKPGT